MKFTNRVLYNVDGTYLRVQSEPGVDPGRDAPPLTVAKVLSTVAVSRSPNQSAPSEEINVGRLYAAIVCQQAKPWDEIEIDSKVASALKTDTQALFAPVVAAQVALAIENKPTPLAELALEEVPENLK